MQRPILGPVLASLGVLLLLAAGHLLPELFPPELETIHGRVRHVEVERVAESPARSQPGLTRGAVLVRVDGQPLRFRFPLGLFGDAEDVAERLSEDRWLQLAVDRGGLESSRRAHAWYESRGASATAAPRQAHAADRGWRVNDVADAVASVPIYEIRSGPTMIASRIAFDPGQTGLACLAFALGVVALLTGFRFGACEDDA